MNVCRLFFADGYDKLSEEEKDNLMGWFEEEGAKVESLFKSWLKAKTSPNVKQPPTAPESFDPKHPEHSTLIAQGREIFHGKAGGLQIVPWVHRLWGWRAE